MRRILLILTGLAMAGAGAYWYLYLRAPAPTPGPQTAIRRGTGVPVLVVPAEVKNVPIYLDGLGTVQASATVTVKAQVDGKLIAVNFTEGQMVTAGTVIARIDPRGYQAALDQALAAQAKDKATLANARLDVTRYAKLAATAYTSAQQFDTARATVAQLEAQVAVDQALIDTARVNLGYTSIVAPIDGRIGIRQVDVGNIVRSSDAAGLCVITNLQPISVMFTLPQQSLRLVSEALQKGTPAVLALPQDGSADVLDRGTLTVLDNQVDPMTGTIKLKASFPNPTLRLWPGAFVNVRLLVDTRQNAITVPPAAIQRGPAGAFTYVLKPDNTVERRQVRVGHEDVTASVVIQGLAAGDRVVTDGAARLSDGARVNVADPNAPPPVPIQRRGRPAL
jgi:multidrug efflux system membrane fusion protein